MKSISRKLLFFLMLIVVMQPLAAIADALIKGVVEDIYNRPVIGGTVTIKHGNESLQETVTDVKGEFNLEFTFGQYGVVQLKVDHSSYVVQQIDVDIVDYEPNESTYTVC